MRRRWQMVMGSVALVAALWAIGALTQPRRAAEPATDTLAAHR